MTSRAEPSAVCGLGDGITSERRWAWTEPRHRPTGPTSRFPLSLVSGKRANYSYNEPRGIWMKLTKSPQFLTKGSAPAGQQWASSAMSVSCDSKADDILHLAAEQQRTPPLLRHQQRDVRQPAGPGRRWCQQQREPHAPRPAPWTRPHLQAWRGTCPTRPPSWRRECRMRHCDRQHGHGRHTRQRACGPVRRHA